MPPDRFIRRSGVAFLAALAACGPVGPFTPRLAAQAATAVIRTTPGATVRRPPTRTVRRTVVVAPVRPVPAVRPSYWGSVVAGVTIGAIVTVAAVNAVPKAPSPELCWFWSDSSKTRGYWNYCVAPRQP
jgi:hypothetical protein